MRKDGLQDKEKVLRRLSEKEIQAQLYGYGSAGPAPAADSQAEEPPKPKPQPKQPQVKAQPKNPYLVWQIVLLAFFLILIWISVRQIAKAAARSFKANVSVKSNAAQDTGKVRILQHKVKGTAKKR